MPHVAAPPLPPPPYRWRALDDLERLIARVEADFGRLLAAVERWTAAGGGPCPARAELRLAERHLAMLRQSRELLLLAGEVPPEGPGGRR